MMPARIPPIAFFLVCLTASAAGLGAQTMHRVTRLGAARTYGPGIIHASLGELRFELSRPAEVIVLQVDPVGGITPMFPVDTEPSVRPSGVHVLLAPAPQASAGEELRLAPRLQTAADLARAGRSVRPPAAGMPDTASIVAYWLVIVSDVPTTGRDLRAQLEEMKLEYGSVEAELKALPPALVGKRTKNWGAFFMPVY